MRSAIFRMGANTRNLLGSIGLSGVCELLGVKDLVRNLQETTTKILLTNREERGEAMNSKNKIHGIV